MAEWEGEEGAKTQITSRELMRNKSPPSKISFPLPENLTRRRGGGEKEDT